MKSNRASHIKSRTGCRTCKRRKVKCDETKPCCNRCLSGKRICEGYGIVIDTPKPPSYHSSYETNREHRDCLPNIQPKLTNGIKILPLLSHSESITFEFFRSQTVFEIAGFRSSSFWQNVVLPACHSEPAILHASMALANASRLRTSRPAPDDIARLGTLSNYNKAIHYLKSHVSLHSDPSSLRIALISCILFISLELSTGRFQEAGMHFNEGRKLLQSSTTFITTTADDEFKTKTLVLVSNPESVEDELLGVFTDLDLQATYFGSHKPQLKLDAHKPTPSATAPPLPYSLDLPTEFSTIKEANKYFTILTNKCLQFIGHKLTPESHSLQNPLPTLQRHLLHTSLKNWKNTYDRFCLRTNSNEKSSRAWKKQSTLMLIQHAWLSVLLSTSYFEVEETDYDAYIKEFTTITELAASVLPESGEEQRQFSLEFGLAAPLSWTVLKCRDPCVRRRALSLVMRAGHEGMWEPKLMSQLGKECLLLEEGIEHLEDCRGWGKEDDWRTRISLQKRVSTATVVFETIDYSMLRMLFRRKVWNSEGEVISMENIVRRRLYGGLECSI